MKPIDSNESHKYSAKILEEFISKIDPYLSKSEHKD